MAGLVEARWRLWTDEWGSGTGREREEERSPAVEVHPAGDKGMGCFAAERIPLGRWICQYEGTLIQSSDEAATFDPLGLIPSPAPSDEQVPAERLVGSDYVFELAPGLCIDAQHSSHFSRFFNHNEQGNLDVEIDVAQLRIDFYAARTIDVGEELTFDCELRIRTKVTFTAACLRACGIAS